MNSLPSLDRSHSKICKLEDQGRDQRVIDRTVVDCLNMVWPLTITAWALKDPTLAKSRLQRHVVRVYRLGD